MNLYNKTNIFWFSYEADSTGLRYIKQNRLSYCNSQPEGKHSKSFDSLGDMMKFMNDWGGHQTKKEIIGTGKNELRKIISPKLHMLIDLMPL
jgi:hypothetical protein